MSTVRSSSWPSRSAAGGSTARNLGEEVALELLDAREELEVGGHRRWHERQTHAACSHLTRRP